MIKKIILIILALTLALAWVFSLRPVRLKVGDYYFKNGNFNQAVNWYEKVVREERLGIDQNRGNHLKYEQNLSKLKSSVILEIEETLFKIGQILGFIENKDLKCLLMDSKIFLKNIDHLIGNDAKEKLKKAKVELQNFSNILNNFKRLWENKTDSKELYYLISIGYFFEGIIEEAKDNFVSADLNYQKAITSSQNIANQLSERRKMISLKIADEYFHRSPLNWVAMRTIHESHIKKGDVKDVNIFLKLAFNYAKFNHFEDSYNCFKKVYDLLKDDIELQNTIDQIKRKGTFLYPDDLSLLPQTFLCQYPFLKEISFFETKTLINILGIKVNARSNGFIGKTGIKTPTNIIIRSAGYLVGNYSHILINGVNVCKNSTGYNIVIINPLNGNVEKSDCFNTSASKEEIRKMKDFINNIRKGDIACVAVANEASASLSAEENNIFQEIGAKGNLYNKYRWGHGIIGVKGSRYGEAIEAISERPLEIYVLMQQGTTKFGDELNKQ